MNQYVTGAMIKALREKSKMTQSALAEKLCISDKTVSKWENGKGFPDITLLEKLAGSLGVSVIELLSGNTVTNSNPCSSILRSHFYVCPVCGNVLFSVGEALISCHGLQLPPLEDETPDENHPIRIETIEDEYYVTIDHPMTKDHYISFIAAVGDNGLQWVKLYPEGCAEARMKKSRVRSLVFYCNQDGLFKIPVKTQRMKKDRPSFLSC